MTAKSPDRIFCNPAFRGASLAWMVLFALALGGLAGCERDEAWVWELVWEDEFEGPAGQLPNSTNWKFDVGTDWGNDQLEYDTDRPENVSLDGYGNLAIIAREESYNPCCDYTSGRITTSGLFEHARGRFEASIKLPVGQGIWPAFWLLGANFSTVGWPTCGEIDIMEYRGQAPTIAPGASSFWRAYELEGPGFNEDFHVFGIEWNVDRITWYIDDTRYFMVTKADVASRGEWVFDHTFFIILNVAVGGTFVGSPDESTVFPQTMLVDWVRVYKGE